MSTSFIPRLLERYIAVDHACGWPNLTLLPNGDLALLAWPEPCHGLWEGAVTCWLSHDAGLTWDKTSVPVPHAPGTNRMNHSTGLDTDGALVAIVSGWEDRSPREQAKRLNFNSDTVPPIPVRSVDGGKSWIPGQPPLPSDKEMECYQNGQKDEAGRSHPMMIPFGDIWPIGDGSIGSMFYSSRAEFFASSDHGVTWQVRGSLGEQNHTNETTWISLPDGRLLAATRTQEDQHLEQYISEDQGHTWTYDQDLTEDNCHPAGLTALADGSLLLTYGIRKDPLRAIGAKLSRDSGKTWSDQQVLVDLEESTNHHEPEWRDCGYPTNVQLADGTIVTAYYCKGVAAHRRYHVGVLRWRLD